MRVGEWTIFVPNLVIIVLWLRKLRKGGWAWGVVRICSPYCYGAPENPSGNRVKETPTFDDANVT